MATPNASAPRRWHGEEQGEAGVVVKPRGNDSATNENGSTFYDIATVAAAALDSVDSVHRRWLPNGKRNGHEYTARNPTRNDTRPGSFSINVNNGKWSDFATGDAGGDLVSLVAYLEGCSQGEAANRLGQFLGLPGEAAAAPRPKAKPAANDAGELVSPIPADAPPPLAAHFKYGRPSATWTYRDAEGRTLSHAYRFDHADGTKDVLPLTLWEKNGARKWEFKGYPAPRPLYGLDKLAARPDALVLILEGEKDADAAAVLMPAWVATTSPGGCKAADKADWQPTEGKSAVIWPDADEPGEKYAADAERLALESGAACVGRLDLTKLATLRGSPLPKGYGAADALAEGIDRDALAALLFDALAEAEAEPTEPDEPQGETVATIAARTRAAKAKAKAKAGKLPRFEVIEGDSDRRPGVYFFGSTRDKETGEEMPAPPVWVCGPLHITASTRDEQGSEWGRLVEWQDRDGRWHRWALPMEMLAGSGEEMRGAFLRGGLEITSNPNHRRLLADYIAWSRPQTIARAVGRTGWYGAVFVYPHRTEGDTEQEPIFYQSGHVEGLRLGVGGTMDGWRASIATPAAGNSRLVLALSAAFAAPCLGLLGAEGGGLHFRGESSTGKSTGLYAAASAWGPPGYVRSWRATDNALEGIAAQHSDLPLCLDEMGELPPKVAGATAYMLSNGQGKSRADKAGAARVAAHWRVQFVSTGEVGLSDLIAEAGGRTRAGQEVRVIDIPADAGAKLGMFEKLPAGMKPGAFADALRDAAGTHYGHAGPAFVARLVAEHAEAREALRTARDAIAASLAPPDAAGQVRRVARRFALVAAAGELATEYGLTGWTEGEAAAAAAVCFRAWIGARGTTGAAEPAAMLAQVRKFLEAHGESRFAPMDQPENRATINRAGFRRETPDGTEFLVLREVFKAEPCNGFDHRAVARALADAGALVRDADGSATKTERLPGLGSTRVYRITPAIWSTGNA